MFRWIAVTLLPASILLAQTTVQGVVTESARRKPIADAYVTAIRSGLPSASQTVKTAASGAFNFASLAPGTYTLCTQVLSGGYLNPCSWLPNPPTVTVGAAKTIAGIQLKVEAGSVLQVRVNDPAGVLRKAAAPLAPSAIAMGVRTPRGFLEPFTMRSVSEGGSDHEVTIPFDTNVQVWMQSAKLSLAQSDGNLVPAAGSSVTVIHSSTAVTAAPPIVVRITGSKP
ncbi:MAG: carboxypeptidase-like regulatory domain-containing protein [Candidatus Solibacter sp.]